MKVTIYSALYGNYEQPRPLRDLGIPAIMFTDDVNMKAPGWQVQHVPVPEPESPMMKAKFWKIFPWDACPDADVTIWVDASVTVEVGDFVERCLETLGDDDWAAVTHPVRSCIYDEAAFSLTLPRYAGSRIQQQVDAYRAYGHPARWGLFANGLIVRRHTLAVKKVCRQWWWECQRFSEQDQLSLPVLFRLAGDVLHWNANIPWGKWWTAGLHSPLGLAGRVDP